MKKRIIAQKRPRCNTPATSIHRDILSHIYGFLSSHEEHRACLVCRHWSNVLPRSYCLTTTGVHFTTAEAVRNIKENGNICRAFPGSSSESMWANLKHASAQMTNQIVKSLLRCARGMETLVLSRSGQLTSFGLAMVPWPASLIHLNLTSCSLVTDLNFLSQLPNLRYLNLSFCTSIKHRGGFDVLKTHCRALQNLEIERCEGLRNVEFLRGHPALTSIDVTGSQVETFEPLATVRSLQILQAIRGRCPPPSFSFDCFLDHPSLCDIQFDFLPFARALPTLRFLSSFHFSSCYMDGGPLSDDFLDGLTSHPTLRSVSLYLPFGCSSRQLDFIRTLRQLNELDLDGLPENFHFLEWHPSLRDLHLSSSSNYLYLPEHESIGTVPHLESLSFFQVVGVDMRFITNHGCLRKLAFVNCGITSRDVSAVATCPKLNHLEFDDCFVLKDLDFLRDHKTLVVLTVTGAALLQSIHLRVLLSVPKLEFLNIDNCDGVDDISFLAGHPSLLYIYVPRTQVTSQNVQCGFRAPVRLNVSEFHREIGPGW